MSNKGIVGCAFAMICLFYNLADAQTGNAEILGGEKPSVMRMDDSLTTKSPKNKDGQYYKSLSLKYEKGGRLFIDFTGFGKNHQDLCLIFETNAGKSVKYYSKEVLGNKLGKIEIDTSFKETSSVNIFFATAKTMQPMNFRADLFYASPKAMEYNDQKDLCWKLAYLFKHSDNGYKFIKKAKG